MPVGQPSESQANWRARFSQYSRHWKRLSDSNKNKWREFAKTKPINDQFGNEVVLTGFQIWLKYKIFNETSLGGSSVAPSTRYANISAAVTSKTVDAQGFFIYEIELNLSVLWGHYAITTNTLNKKIASKHNTRLAENHDIIVNGITLNCQDFYNKNAKVNEKPENNYAVFFGFRPPNGISNKLILPLKK